MKRASNEKCFGMRHFLNALSVAAEPLRVHCYGLSSTRGGAHASGVQFATKTIDEGVKAARLAAEAGATFVDLNCGCPIYGRYAVPLSYMNEGCLYGSISAR
jgi:hypothetical protein